MTLMESDAALPFRNIISKTTTMITTARFLKVGSMSRSFYVGESITEEEIKARFENGVLSLTVPKAEAKKLPEKKVIMIE